MGRILTGVGDNRDFVDKIDVGDGLFNLCQIDAIAANFDPSIAAPGDNDGTVGKVAAKVAGSVRTSIGGATRFGGRELFLGRLAKSNIAAGETIIGYDDLTQT